MKWTWDKFGFRESEGYDVARLIPEIAAGTMNIVAASRDLDVLRIAVVGAGVEPGRPVAIDPNAVHRICLELGVKSVQLLLWSDDPKSFIPIALLIREVEDVLLCDMIGRAFVLVKEDQVLLAIGRRGQNVRLASKLSGWDIEVMTARELNEQIDRALLGFGKIEGMTDGLPQQLVEQGYLTYDDLSMIAPDALMEIGELSAGDADTIIEQAEIMAEDEKST